MQNESALELRLKHPFYIVFQQVFWTLLGSLQLLRVKSTVEHKKKAESLKDANRLDALRLVVWCFLLTETAGWTFVGSGAGHFL